jgi:hypothetical protein
VSSGQWCVVVFLQLHMIAAAHLRAPAATLGRCPRAVVGLKPSARPVYPSAAPGQQGCQVDWRRRRRWFTLEFHRPRPIIPILFTEEFLFPCSRVLQTHRDRSPTHVEIFWRPGLAFVEGLSFGVGASARARPGPACTTRTPSLPPPPAPCLPPPALLPLLHRQFESIFFVVLSRCRFQDCLEVAHSSFV